MFKHEAKYQIVLFLGPAVLAMWAGIFLPFFGPYGLMAVSIATIGMGLLLFAKLSEKRRTKQFVSWGSSQMTFREKTSYFIGYFLIFLYVGLSIYLSLNSASHLGRGL